MFGEIFNKIQEERNILGRLPPNSVKRKVYSPMIEDLEKYVKKMGSNPKEEDKEERSLGIQVIKVVLTMIDNHLKKGEKD